MNEFNLTLHKELSNWLVANPTYCHLHHCSIKCPYIDKHNLTCLNGLYDELENKHEKLRKD